VVTPLARYGHQSKLDVEVDRGAPTAGISWRGRMVEWAIIKEGIAMRKHKDGRAVVLSKNTQADGHPSTAAKSSGLPNRDSALH
jgi:hypothetical protein